MLRIYYKSNSNLVRRTNFSIEIDINLAPLSPMLL